MIIFIHKDVLGLVEKMLLLYGLLNKSKHLANQIPKHGLATFPAFHAACKM